MFHLRVAMAGTMVRKSPITPVKTCEYSSIENAIRIFIAMRAWKR